jgi:hypothetical protein
MWFGLVVLLATGIAEYFGEVWSIEHTHAVSRNLPLGHKPRVARVRKACKWTLLLLLLGHSDTVAASLGFTVVLWAIPGSLIGGYLGTRQTMWRKFRRTDQRLASARKDQDDDDDE